MGKYAKIFLPCFFIFSSSSFFTNLHSLFPVPFYCFLLIFPFVLHFNSIWKRRFKNRIVTRRSALLLSVEGKTYKTMNPKVPIKEMLWTHLHPMTQPNGKKQVGKKKKKKETGRHSSQQRTSLCFTDSGGDPCGHNSSIVLSCFSQCLTGTSDKIFMPGSLCHGPIFCLHYIISYLLPQ